MTTLPYKSSDHLPISLAALYAGQDLPWRTRLKIVAHLRHCAACEQKVDSFRMASVELRKEAEAATLTGFEAIADWSRLEREMMGNISVGVAAARCVDKVKRKTSLSWRVAFGVGLGVLFAAGWMTHIPHEETDRLFASLRQWAGGETRTPAGTVLRSSPESLVVRSHGTTLTLLHPRSALTSVSGSSAVQASYVDEETGQITITSVYGLP